MDTWGQAYRQWLKPPPEIEFFPIAEHKARMADLDWRITRLNNLIHEVEEWPTPLEVWQTMMKGEVVQWTKPPLQPVREQHPTVKLSHLMRQALMTPEEERRAFLGAVERRDLI